MSVGDIEPVDWHPHFSAVEDVRVPTVHEAADMLRAAIERDRALGRVVAMPFPIEALGRIAVSDTEKSLTPA